jgi:hypothetical protein
LLITTIYAEEIFRDAALQFRHRRSGPRTRGNRCS